MTHITVTPDRTKLLVRFPYNEDLVARVKMITGRVWSKPLHGWMFPFTTEMLHDLTEVFKQFDEVRVDPYIKEHVDVQVREAKANIEVVNNPYVNTLPGDLRFNTVPYEHQKKALSLCLDRKSYALFMEMGTGKTKVMVDLLGYIKGRTLVICPVSVMDAWVREVRLHQPDLKSVLLTGSKNTRLQYLDVGIRLASDVFIINYESAWRLEPEINKYKWDNIILDESTKIKHRASKQAKGIMKLGDKCARKYIMTGTPSPNSPLELFNQIKFLDPTIFGTNWYVFRDRYAVMGGYQGYQVIGWKNLKELSTKLAGISYRVLKKDCLDLPEKIYKEYRLEMPENLKLVYKSLAEDLVASVNGQMITASVVLAKLTKLRQMTSGFVYGIDGEALPMPENPKLSQLEEILSQILDNHKVVIWCTFREELRLVEKLCREKFRQNSIAIIDGSVSQEKRGEAIARFQSDPNTKVFIGQQHAGGLGITLTAGDYCIFLSNDYSPEIRLQCEDRLHRIGQKNNVTYIDLIMKATVDVSIKRMLRQKQNLSDSISSINVKEAVYGNE